MEKKMKVRNTLLASVALALAAGSVAAEVAITGDGRLGVKSVNGGDVEFTSRVRIVFTASGVTDSGLSFGGSIRADNAGGGAAGTGGSVFIMGPFGTISAGDVDSAAKASAGQVSGIGLTGLGDLHEIPYIGGKDDPSLQWSYTMDSLTLRVSADNPGAKYPATMGQMVDTNGDVVGKPHPMAGMEKDTAFSGGVSYAIGDVGVGVGVERVGDIQNVVASANATLGNASVKLVYGSRDDGVAATEDDSYGASASFTSGMATFTAFASNTNNMDHFGIGMAYDLGGASIKGGFVDGDSLTDASFDLGISMGF
ncbi:MAG: porin [Boseongicola sp. SB0665_bin_10]|nr:porin [Boseongicola sp. SB0665_bin_10]